MLIEAVVRPQEQVALLDFLPSVCYITKPISDKINQPLLVNKSINLGVQIIERIDLAQKIQSCDAIHPMHSLCNPNIVTEL